MDRTALGKIEKAARPAAARPPLLTAARPRGPGEVLQNDDTTVKILELMAERSRYEIGAEADEAEPRSGLFASGMVALRSWLLIQQNGTERGCSSLLDDRAGIKILLADELRFRTRSQGGNP